MDTESKGQQAAHDAGLERAIVLQLLRDDHERMWSRAQLAIELSSELNAAAPDAEQAQEGEQAQAGRQAVEDALRRLERDGVIGITSQQAWASGAARRLDELGLIAV
jgi:hypothetical protein